MNRIQKQIAEWDKEIVELDAMSTDELLAELKKINTHLLKFDSVGLRRYRVMKRLAEKLL